MNKPENWNLDYIKYEICHLISKERQGDDNPRNLSFQSASCSSFKQNHKNYKEVTEYIWVPEVTQRVNKLLALHDSQQWINLENTINNICLKFTKIIIDTNNNGNQQTNKNEDNVDNKIQTKKYI